MDTATRLRKLYAEHLGLNDDRIKDDSTFYGDLGCDSLDTLELTMATEEEFGHEITDAEAEAVNTFADALRLVESKIAADAANR